MDKKKIILPVVLVIIVIVAAVVWLSIKSSTQSQNSDLLDGMGEVEYGVIEE